MPTAFASIIIEILPFTFTAKSQKVPRIECSVVMSVYLSNPRMSDNIPVKRTTVSDSFASLILADSTIGWNFFNPSTMRF